MSKQLDQNFRYRNSRRVAQGFPSFDLKGSFKSAFFLELGGLELRDLFSTGTTVEVRRGRQLLERIPQFSNKQSPLPLPTFSEDEISSRKTGGTSFGSTELLLVFTILPEQLPELLAGLLNSSLQTIIDSGHFY